MRSFIVGYKKTILAAHSRGFGVADVSKIVFLGGGKMAEAMVSGLTQRGGVSPEKITVTDINENRLQHFRDTFGKLNTAQASDSASVVEGADVVVFSVKPQHSHQVISDIHGYINPKSLVISICAGVTLETFVKGLGCSSVVRAMPNTPASIGEGMTAWISTSKCTENQLAQARSVVGSFGQEIQVDAEEYIDMATALCGTGPAYFFLVMESMIDVAVHMGFPRHIAQKMVVQTMRGTALYAEASGEHPAILRNDITSPGGTTAAALYASDRGGFRTVVSDSVWAAYRRSLELGGKNANVGPGSSTRP